MECESTHDSGNVCKRPDTGSGKIRKKLGDSRGCQAPEGPTYYHGQIQGLEKREERSNTIINCKGDCK